MLCIVHSERLKALTMDYRKVNYNFKASVMDFRIACNELLSLLSCVDVVPNPR